MIKLAEGRNLKNYNTAW